MTRRAAFREQAWPDDPVFAALAIDWSHSAANQILDWVWRAFDSLHAQHLSRVNLTQPLEQLERDLTDLHFGEILQLWGQDGGGEAGYYPDHEIPEYESRHSAMAQPPAYDLGFVLRENPRYIWPIEAKVVRKASQLAAYLGDVRDKFIAGIAAPFVGQAGMIGYLLTGTPDEVFTGLEPELSQSLDHPLSFIARTHRTSYHERGKSPFGRELPNLLLHHLVMVCATQD